MHVVLYTPQWFLGIDSIFESISIVISLLIFVYSYKAYRFTSEKRYLAFSLAFLSIALSFVAKITTDVNAYFSLIHRNPALMEGLRHIHITWATGYFFYHFFALLGLVILLMLCCRIHDKRTIALFIFFTFISSLLAAYNTLFFYLISTVILAFVFANFYEHFEAKKTKYALLVAVAFGTLLISQGVLIFVSMYSGMYVLGELLQLIGYGILLFTYFLVLK